MKKIKMIFLMMGLFVGMGFGFKIYAYDTPAAFTINKLWIGGDGSFRISQTSTTAQHCTGGPTNPAWSYLGANDTGFKTKEASLLAAYLAGKTVELTTETVEAGYCHIVEFWVY